MKIQSEESGYTSCSSGSDQRSLCSTPPASPEPVASGITSTTTSCNVKKLIPSSAAKNSSSNNSNGILNQQSLNNNNTTKLVGGKRGRVSDEEERRLRLMERKRRNRESAERSRQRKLQFYKELEVENNRLKSENDKLKTQVEALKASPTTPSSSPSLNAATSSVVNKLTKENEELKAKLAKLEGLLQQANAVSNKTDTTSKQTVESVVTPCESIAVQAGKEESHDADNLNHLLDDLMAMNGIKQEEVVAFEDDLFAHNLFAMDSNDDDLDIITGTADSESLSLLPSLLKKKNSLGQHEQRHILTLNSPPRWKKMGQCSETTVLDVDTKGQHVGLVEIPNAGLL